MRDFLSKSVLRQDHNHQIKSVVDDYIYAISKSKPPLRYSLVNNNLRQQSRAQWKCEFFSKKDAEDLLCTIAAVVFEIYNICFSHGYSRLLHRGNYSWVDKPAVVHCFDPAKNEWEQKCLILDSVF